MADEVRITTRKTVSIGVVKLAIMRPPSFAEYPSIETLRRIEVVVERNWLLAEDVESFGAPRTEREVPSEARAV
jgi:hypothetical protein